MQEHSFIRSLMWHNDDMLPIAPRQVLRQSADQMTQRPLFHISRREAHAHARACTLMPLQNDGAELYDYGPFLSDLRACSLLTAFSRLGWLYFWKLTFHLLCIGSISELTKQEAICKKLKVPPHILAVLQPSKALNFSGFVILLRSFYTSQGLVLTSIFLALWGGC